MRTRRGSPTVPLPLVAQLGGSTLASLGAAGTIGGSTDVSAVVKAEEDLPCHGAVLLDVCSLPLRGCDDYRSMWDGNP